MNIVPCDYLPKEYKGVPIYLVVIQPTECKVLFTPEGKLRRASFIGITYHNESLKEESIIVPIYSMSELVGVENKIDTEEQCLTKNAEEAIDAALSGGFIGTATTNAACYVFRHKQYPNICAICTMSNKDSVIEFFYSVSVPVKKNSKIYPYRYRMERV